MFIAAGLIGPCATAAGPDRLQQLIDEPARWAAYDWANPAGLAVHNEAGWVYAIEIAVPGVEPTLERTLQAYGGAWRVQWIPQGSPPLWMYRDMPSADCPAVIESFGRTLGPAALDEERSHETRNGRAMESVVKHWRWQVGRTQIDAICNADSDDQPGQVQWMSIRLYFDSIEGAKLREQAAPKPSVHPRR